MTNNTAGTAGGGVYARKDTVTISGSTISGNRANGDVLGVSGGGILHWANGEDSTMSISRSTISGDHAAKGGGGIDNSALRGLHGDAEDHQQHDRR